MRKTPKKWSEEEIDFIKNNYYRTSCEYCAEQLNLPIDVVYGKISRLKLKKECKYDLELFKNVTNKYVSYLLGYIWADGHIHHNRIILSIIRTDGDEIVPIFDKIGYYKLHYMKEMGKNKEKTSFVLYSSELTDFFRKHDYGIKSKVSPNKILELISDELKQYFFRGLIDGDGCFYNNKKHSTYQFTVSSTYEQDWSYMINLCDSLNISRYEINKQNRKLKNGNQSKYSQFRLCRKNDVKLLGNYIYQDYDQIGLKRKYNKFKEIC